MSAHDRTEHEESGEQHSEKPEILFFFQRTVLFMSKKTEEEIQEMREVLAEQGIEELTSSGDVEEFLNRDGTSMIVINSVCGCAGEAIRQGVANVFDELDIDHAGTVFAGEDVEATKEVRRRAPEDEPSSPSIYLYRDGDKRTYIPRKFTLKHQYDPEKVSEKLASEVQELSSLQAVS